jgi:hypothetical protein
MAAWVREGAVVGGKGAAPESQGSSRQEDSDRAGKDRPSGVWAKR